MAIRRVGTAATMAIALAALAACQPGAVAPGATQAGRTTSIPGAVVTGLDGTVTWASDGTSGTPDAFQEEHQKLSVNVHLVDRDGTNLFVDSGTTYTYSSTRHEEDAQTLALCGYHGESTGSGSGAFIGPGGRISAYYVNGNSDVGLNMKVPFANTSSGTDLCNGQTIAGTTPDSIIPSCNDPADSALVGQIKPGNVSALVLGDTIDFTCSYTFVLGTGGVVATGSLTTR